MQEAPLSLCLAHRKIRQISSRKWILFHYTPHGIMDVQDLQGYFLKFLDELSDVFQKLPGSSILLRYIKSSYQNDPVRSGIELFLLLFALRYLLAPAYSTQKKSYVKLTEEACNSLLVIGDVKQWRG